MLDEDALSQLTRTVSVFHKELLIADLMKDLNYSRQRFQMELVRISKESSEGSVSFAEHPRWQDIAQVGSRVLASEYLIALAMTNCNGAAISTPKILSALIESAHSMLVSAQDRGSLSIKHILGDISEDYEQAITHHVGDSQFHLINSPSALDEKYLHVKDKYQYLDEVFRRDLNVGWNDFIDTINILLKHSFYHGLFVNKNVVLESLKEIENREEILNLLEFDREKAEAYLAKPLWRLNQLSERALFWSPVVKIDENYFVMPQVLEDSFERYVYMFRKRHGAFVKGKGHLFENQVCEILENLGFEIIERNRVVMEEIVKGEMKAEYDIIAGSPPYLLVFECKAYHPDVNGRGFITKRKEQGLEFATKIAKKAEYVSSHPQEFLESAHRYQWTIPVLITTYPLVKRESIKNVLCVTMADLRELENLNMIDETYRIAVK
nr:MAG: hypothetical protein AM325_12505 [Candidatus Thorarchaeota archaeon SMTZ1-45]